MHDGQQMTFFQALKICDYFWVSAEVKHLTGFFFLLLPLPPVEVSFSMLSSERYVEEAASSDGMCCPEALDGWQSPRRLEVQQ